MSARIMKIGIVRHFKVEEHTTKYWMSAQQFSEWVDHYNRASIEENTMITASDWDCCYSSDMDRALQTTERLYQGKPVITPHLREIDIKPLFQTRLKLHLNMWLFLGRAGWIFNHPSQESRSLTSNRANHILNEIEEGYKGRNVLIVTHGAFMMVLRKALIERGYIGDRFYKPENGRVYIFKKEKGVYDGENRRTFAGAWDHTAES